MDHQKMKQEATELLLLLLDWLLLSEEQRRHLQAYGMSHL